MTGYAAVGGLLALVGVAWGFYAMGRDIATRDAYTTISSLRAYVARLRLTNERQARRIEALEAALEGARGRVVQIPEWISEDRQKG